MLIRGPQRFSAEWWIWLSGGGLAAGVVTAAGLYLNGIVTEPLPLLLVALAGSVAGDVVLALALERIAPTAITLSPGERERHDHDIDASGVVISGFGDTNRGRVRVGGETWAARSANDAVRELGVGDIVKVVARDGLTLLVEADKR